jgi:hypothetical protein
VASPAPYYNFHVAPTVTAGPYEFDDLVYDTKIGGYVERKPTPAE